MRRVWIARGYKLRLIKLVLAALCRSEAVLHLQERLHLHVQADDLKHLIDRKLDGRTPSPPHYSVAYRGI